MAIDAGRFFRVGTIDAIQPVGTIARSIMPSNVITLRPARSWHD